jgi:hypothetical protein
MGMKGFWNLWKIRLNPSACYHRLGRHRPKLGKKALAFGGECLLDGHPCGCITRGEAGESQNRLTLLYTWWERCKSS